MVEAVDRVFDEMDDDGSGTIEYHELNKALSDDAPEVGPLAEGRPERG